MQRKIIALAIAAAFSAPAFADTTVYGIADAAIANISASGTQTDTLAFSGGLAGSRIGVNSAEDLGNGMKAVVNLEYSLDIETATGTTDKFGTPAAAVGNGSGIGAARQQMLALAGGFGTVATGYLQTTGYDFGKSFDPTAGSLVSPLDNITGANKGQFLIGTNAGLKRAPRALAYISPNMGGLSVALNYSGDAAGGTGNLGNADGTTSKASAGLASVNYAQGPLAAAVVIARYMNTAAGAAPAGVNETAVGVSYDLEVAKLFATYQTNKADGADNSNKVMSISGVIPAGPGAVALTYAKATLDANNAGGTDKNASGYTVAWLQGLSKTTTFYAAYTNMGQGSDTNVYSVAKNAIGGTMTGGTSSGMVAVGLSKKF